MKNQIYTQETNLYSVHINESLANELSNNEINELLKKIDEVFKEYNELVCCRFNRQLKLTFARESIYEIRNNKLDLRDFIKKSFTYGFSINQLKSIFDYAYNPREGSHLEFSFL